jgi:hypothetical protein
LEGLRQRYIQKRRMGNEESTRPLHRQLTS